MKVTVVDYGVGNIFSVCQALKFLKIDFSIDDDGKKISSSDSILIPGVAAFGVGVQQMKRLGQFNEIANFKQKGNPILGLCLGAQVLFHKSEEAPESLGLGIVPGEVRSLNTEKCQVPKQGWSGIDFSNSPAFKDFNAQKFYFSHSYKMEPEKKQDIVGLTNYSSEEVVALYHHENMLGAQFHPERSGEVGLRFLEFVILNATLWK